VPWIQITPAYGLFVGPSAELGVSLFPREFGEFAVVSLIGGTQGSQIIHTGKL
jgi:hypothetical protein